MLYELRDLLDGDVATAAFMITSNLSITLIPAERKTKMSKELVHERVCQSFHRYDSILVATVIDYVTEAKINQPKRLTQTRFVFPVSQS